MEAVAAKLVIGVLLALSQAFTSGLEALQQQRHEEAISAFSKVIDQPVPGNHWRPLALHYRARAYQAQGDSDAAKRDLTLLLSGDVPADLHPQAHAFFRQLGGTSDDILPAEEPPRVWEAFMAACQKGDVAAAMRYCTPTHETLYELDPERYTEYWQSTATNVIGTYHVLAWRVEPLGPKLTCLLALQNQTDDLYRVDMLKQGNQWRIAKVERMRGYADPEINWVRLHRMYRVLEMYADQHEGKLPPSLEHLITTRQLRRREAEWRHPETGQHTLFAYCDTIELLEDSETVLIASPETIDSRRLVLYANGQVRALPEADFLAAARAQNWRAPGAIKPGQVNDEQRSYIQQLVEQLGAETFATREQAKEKLLEVGQAAVPYLEALQDDADPEIRLTVRALLDEMLQ